VTDLLPHVDRSLQDRGLLSPGDAVLVGVSGGVDSMVLLHALKRLAPRRRWKLVVAHLNHRLRGADADADERLVRRTAKALRLPVVVEAADVKRFARRSGMSIEMAGRKLRHEFFARTAAGQGIQTVALAHHADDQVELFFLRLFRGTGAEGLGGMKWRSPSPADPSITLVRPLLDVNKAGLRAFAASKKIRFREDDSNRSSDFLRNRIRNRLLPLLAKEYQPALSRTVLRLMEIVGAESRLVSEIADAWPKTRLPAFTALPVALQRRILQAQLAQFGVASDFDLIDSLRRSPDAFVSIGPGLEVACRTNGDLVTRRAPAAFDASELTVTLAGAGREAFGGVDLRWETATAGAPRFGPGREFFDAEKVGRSIVLRHWRAGDRFQPIGAKAAAKLQDLFVNAKVPRDERRRLVVATTAGGEIFWVEKLRIAERFKLTPSTRQRLDWAWKRNSR